MSEKPFGLSWHGIVYSDDIDDYLKCVEDHCPYGYHEDDEKFMHCSHPNSDGRPLHDCIFLYEDNIPVYANSNVFETCSCIFYKTNDAFNVMWYHFMKDFFNTEYCETVEEVLMDIFPDKQHIWKNDLIIYKAMKD